MPVIRISDELFKVVQGHAEPLVDNFESALWKLLKSAGVFPKQETMPKSYAKNAQYNLGDLTPPGEYWRPILETLIEAGGQAQRRTILIGVERKMKDKLKPRDYELNKDGTQKWEKQTDFQRLAMVHEGLITGKPRAAWQIADEGRAWLKRRYG